MNAWTGIAEPRARGRGQHPEKGGDGHPGHPAGWCFCAGRSPDWCVMAQLQPSRTRLSSGIDGAGSAPTVAGAVPFGPR
ncbi:hypothetical protein PSN_2373 [Pseudomonas sp. NGC7]